MSQLEKFFWNVTNGWVWLMSYGVLGVLHPFSPFSFCLAYCECIGIVSATIFWHTECQLLGFFQGRGGYMQTWLTGGATQIQKRVILVLCQIIDSPHVFITVLHWHSYQVRWGLFTAEYIYRIGRAGWINTTFNFYDRQKSRCTRRRRFDLQATS